MKTASLTQNRMVVMSKLLEFLCDNRFRNTTINFTNGIITTELKISFFKKDKILFKLNSPNDSETQVEISANRKSGHQIITDVQQEEELIKRISSISEKIVNKNE